MGSFGVILNPCSYLNVKNHTIFLYSNPKALKSSFWIQWIQFSEQKQGIVEYKADAQTA